MAAAKDKKSVMDVSKPGKSPADATTRPIITGHTMMKDPMVTEEKPEMEGVVTEKVETAQETTPEKVAAPSAAHKIIQPLDAAAEKPESTEEKPAEEAEPKEVEDQTEKKETPVTEDAVVDAVLDQVGDKKEETKESEEERKRQEIVDKLVEEKKYFVPIGQERKRRNSRMALLVIGALLPVIVGLGLAADAGAINLGFKVPFDFIKDKPSQPVNNQSTQNAVIPVAPALAMKGVPDTDTAKWTSLKSQNGGFTIKAPDGWQMMKIKGATNGLASSNTVYSAGVPAKEVSEDEAPVQSPSRVVITQQSIDEQQLTFDKNTYLVSQSDFTSGSLKGVRYYQKYPVQTLLGFYAGEQVYTYVFKTQHTVTYVKYHILDSNPTSRNQLPSLTKSDTPNLDILDKLVKTLQIKQ